MPKNDAVGAHSHSGHGHRGGKEYDETDFEQLYASGVQWSGHPNDALVRIAEDLPPGAAADIGCGEGADAVHLARAGWTVLGVDPADTAVMRSAEAAREAGVAGRTEFLVGDLAALTGRQFDLVSCFYVPYAPDDTVVVGELEKLVAPGGTLAFVHHHFDDPRVLDPRQVAEHLTNLQIVALETAQRAVSSGAGAHHTVDIVLVARKPA